ncbi:MAG TPA: hypothetical protein VLN72_00910 [Gillisia sp.]|nr:hypothetical protein [Gillisia sp.]
MKQFLAIILLPFILSCSVTNAQLNVKNHLDENGRSIPEKEFQESWRDKENNLFRWDYINEEGRREAKLFSPVYKIYKLDYSLFVQKLETITNRTFPENQIFILSYTYLNDLCSEDSSNSWSSQKIKARKQFTTKHKENIEKTPNRVVLNFFEEGILLENSEHSQSEYYFMDKGNFLRNLLFTQTAFCGSMAIIKPNGQTILRNGEYLSQFMADHLKPGNWDLFFPPYAE